MKISGNSVARSLLQVLALFRRGGWMADYAIEEPPLRSELFSADQMEQHGKALAASHSLGAKRARDLLLTRLAENGGVLLRACELLTAAIQDKRPGTPAGEWLLDNFHLIEEEIRTARRHLPKDYSRELPRLGNGPSAGLPRVYDIALETISHGDGQVDPESFGRFIAAYQTVTTLTLGELWAVPIMLRLALIENLRRVGTRLIAHRTGRDLADFWADEMTETAQNDPKSLILVVADMARSNPPMSSSFVAELARRLQGQSAALAMPLNWIEQRLSELGLSIEQLVQSENQQQAADQVSISNSIGSLRLLAATDWHAFVETMSVAERTLREDPGGVYGRMDFATRDHYRHVLEKIARRSGLAEDQVARSCLQLAREAAARNDGDDRAAHVGFYLVGRGLPQLEAVTRMRVPASLALQRISGRYIYLGPIALLTAAFAGGLLAQAHASGARGWLLVLCGILAILGTSQLAVALVNWLATLMVTPRPLPRMDFAKGIAPESQTLVVVPTFIHSAQNVEDLVEALEVRFLGNRDAHLQFGLLTDFADAREETLPQDEPLLQLAEQRIAALNEKYRGTEGAGDDDVFFLLHRPRRWNPRERVWMGYERKRGKLGDLNALLRGGALDRFSRIVGRIAILSSVRYVITLDTDTQLPRDAARQLAGTMAHPLNRARYDDASGRVTEGHAILQPRMAVSLTDANRTRYARLHGEEAGIDPYTRMVSDVYQDLFGEGSFIGKGIYEVDAFERALKGRFPENRILSHDLLEGCYARAGLASDVQLYEQYPARYSEDVSRRHRWMRGDWQLVGWLRRRVPRSDAGSEKNPLSGLAQWKIFDNLRRSLVAPALTVLLLLGWTILSPAWFWTVAVLAVMLLPALSGSIVELFRKPDDAVLRSHLAGVLRSAGGRLAQAAFSLACLPFEACFSLDAILRSAVRLVTRRRLLEWTPSGQLDGNSSTGLLDSFRWMWIAPFLAITTMLYLLQARPGALAVAAPILLLWLASPLVVWWLGRPLARPQARLSPGQTAFLRLVSRKTWAFFETLVGPDDHWLPPDNLQEGPAAVLARRTSPTNMGLALLANLSAYDFGYLTAGQLLQRTRNAFATMHRLERYRGHFYNWYDTQSLQPLLPMYVSTVDSGNLAGHLLTLRPGLAALAERPILAARWLEGLEDTLRALREAAPQIASRALLRFRQDLASALADRPATLPAARQVLQRLAANAAQVLRDLDEESRIEADSEPAAWARALDRQCRDVLDELTFLAPSPAMPDMNAMPTLRELAVQGVAHAKDRMEEIARLALQAGQMAHMDYDFLYDEVRHLLVIGYSVTERRRGHNVTEHRRDASYYDLLASEARLAVFVAIAQDQLPQQSWFALGRLLIDAGSGATLLSWSGSMFEYLMPLIVMPAYDNTLLDESCRAAVRRQIEYGAERGVPWGMSESGYNTVDAALTYQYRAFGVPGLGLKRGLSEDLVIAPYATALALMVEPEAACENLQRLAADGILGRFGFYEAVDYTPARLRRGETSAVVRSYMAHHQAMSLLSLAHLLLDRPMQRRFASDPLFQATLLLLQERIPRAKVRYSSDTERVDSRAAAETLEMPMRVFSTPDTRIPGVQLLSNGRYNVMITNAGGGYSCWKDIAVTRWREDGTSDQWGTFCYLRDLSNGKAWSSAFQPTLQRPDHYEAVFTEQRVEFRRHGPDFDTHTEIVVSPEDDIELRRLRITNRSRSRRTIEVTSYAEVVLASAAADALHPAFGNLFVQTEIVNARQTILCTRRPRSRGEQAPWMLHLMAVHGAEVESVSYETDRARFIGRGNSVAAPQALRDSSPLSGSQGSVLDPIVAIRQRITLDPAQTATLDLVTGIGDGRAACLQLAEKYQDRRLADRAFEMAWTHSQVALRQINVTEAEAQLYGRLAGSIIYANATLRAEASVIAKNRRGQSGLWGYAISGDLPIVLVQLKDPANIELVRQLVQAHAYWRLKGLAVDLVIWNEERGGYRQLLHDQIMGLIAAGVEAHVIDRPGGIFVRSADQISNEDRILLQAVARAVFTDSQGTLKDQVKRHPPGEPAIPRFAATRVRGAAPAQERETPSRDLVLDNGLGGFTPDGREYVITTTPGQATPAPWVNVLANPHFGCVISDSGAAYTWHQNAHEFRLTPWHNDSVGDASGEAYYLRDEESGHYWSPSALPCRGTGAYVSRHGFGYSVFEHSEDGIETELTVYVAHDLPVKFAVLKVRNASGRSRRLSATGYVEWVLGALRPKSSMHVVTEIDPNSGALLARNAYNPEFAEQVAFFDVDDVTRTISGDRTEFIGRNGTLANPAALARARLSGKVGAAMDPCAAIQVPFDLADGSSREIIFRMGVGRGTDDASRLVQRLRKSSTASAALEAAKQHWKRVLGAVQIETPDVSLNVLCNGWLLYQTMAARLWGRSGHYQSGGAFGFRDQLQDVMALVHADAQLVREHLLLCASRQFLEGDVQHWWHPPSGRGVRTRCSDDYLWLPLATCRYVLCTGDRAVLREQVQFLDGRAVNPEEDSYYDLPLRSLEAASLYQHCVRAILMGLRFGAHGLPLMGSGDWNDGMNLVGAQGKGESVWLAFFLHDVLTQFAPIARGENDAAFADRCEAEAARLRGKIDQHGWDGEWYRRAYFDNGMPLGSSGNAECRIDSIAQSWSVLSGAGAPERSRQAMEALDRRLVRRDHALVQLLDPPFDTSDLDPGYIRGYVPGVRENGGQYTHAAIWAAMAFAALGETARAWELLGMINPLHHGESPERTAVYKVEPYVVAADVYAVAPHTGRGGWTWYTGSAGWLYRLIMESLLGLRLTADRLQFAPCLPADWQGFQLHYRYRETLYHITVRQVSDDNGIAVSVDGVVQSEPAIPLADDRLDHQVEVTVQKQTIPNVVRPRRRAS
ncbi:MAG: cyclic beta 1-2 glucan synthetase [Betaproteobacteria bacterium RBG_16_66_20]|nr:MAG: cyclic beta 1-2 glucan synthetase [Betaproteobacteria bacterium RBG_16_66_20]